MDYILFTINTVEINKENMLNYNFRKPILIKLLRVKLVLKNSATIVNDF